MADSHYCPMCGVHHGGEAEAEAAAVTDTAHEYASADVRIAEINADRDIKLARISAGMMDHDRDVEAARTEGKAEALEQVLTPEPEPEPEPVADAPVIVDEPEPEADETDPPVAEPGPGHHTAKPRGLGLW